MAKQLLVSQPPSGWRPVRLLRRLSPVHERQYPLADLSSAIHPRCGRNNFAVAGASIIIRITRTLVCLVLAGCGGAGDGNRVPVVGKVTFPDGKPLHRGVVIFAPDGAKGNESLHEPRGPIDDQ